MRKPSLRKTAAILFIVVLLAGLAACGGDEDPDGRIVKINDEAITNGQFENFCTDIYKSGWEDGKASVNALDVKDIEVVIRSVKGIGEVRIGKIMEAINEKFDENAGSKETE